MTEFTNFIQITNWPQIIGVLGFILYLSSFAGLQLRLLNGDSLTYSAANVIAAACVMASLTVDFNLASALIQGSWIVIGTFGLILRVRKSNQTSTTDVVA